MLVKGCAWCGYNWSAEALQLDHIEPNDPEKFGGYGAMSDWMYAANPLPREISAEMATCQILCANCHAERNRLQRERGEIRHIPYSARPDAAEVWVVPDDDQLVFDLPA